MIFSSFVKFLDLIEARLNSDGFETCRIDGSMSRSSRQLSLKRFNSECGPRIILISLNAGGQGLTLTKASTVFLCNPWWNSSIEEQAMDRVHRIGQTREVTVFRMMVSSSIEERVIDIQERKLNLSKQITTSSLSDKQERSFARLSKLFE